MSGLPLNYSGEIPRALYLGNNSPHESSSAPSTLSPSTPSSALPGVAMLAGPQILNPQDISNGRLPYPPSHSVHIPPINDIQSRYIPEYDPAIHQEQLRMHGVMNVAPNMSAIGPPLIGQKRAYRQRRKDPSCDACRERKVKCDATETSSCSECSSRSVKCQFTKETNRRMSSIKYGHPPNDDLRFFDVNIDRQVQDLERQLHEARQQVSQLQTKLQPLETEERDLETTPTSRPSKRRRVQIFQDAAKVLKNLRLYGEGIFNVDFGNGSTMSLDSSPDLPQLPSREVVEDILRTYKSSSHSDLPFLDVDYYLSHWEEIYRTVKDRRSDKLAVLFGLIAVGGLNKYPVETERALQGVLTLISISTQKPSLDMIRATTLASMALTELNQLSSAYRLQGQAVREAQSLGLNCRLASSGTKEVQKCAIWCSLYCIEPSLAVELGLPTMFLDEDHDKLAEWANEQLTGQRYDQLRIALNTARATVLISKSTGSANLTDSIITRVDIQLDGCVRFLPLPYQPLSKENIQAAGFTSAIHLQDLRLLLHRKQLGPMNSFDVRANSLEACMRIVASTIDLLTRLRQGSKSGETASINHQDERSGWKEQLSSAAATYFCLHIWRSFLFLIACGHYTDARLCAEVCTSIGSSRIINEACGRYADFFLRWCIEEKQSPMGALLEDEELLAYLSADMQGSLEQAWVWQEDPEIESSTNQLLIEDEGPDRSQSVAWDRVSERLRIMTRRDSTPLRAIIPSSRPETSSSAGQQTNISNRISIADII